MVGTQNTRSRLRETLKQEDSSLAERLPPVAAPARKEKVSPAVAAEPKASAPPARPPKPAASPSAPKSVPTAKRQPTQKPAGKTVVVTVAESVTPRVEPVAVKPAKASIAKKGKAGKEKAAREKSPKVARDSFSMPVDEHKRIKALREALAQAGCEASKSAVLRAGVALLAGRGLGEIIQLIADLPKVPKGKRGKKH